MVIAEQRAPHEPPTPANLLRLTGHVETPAERVERVLKVIRTRCSSVLTEDDLALVLKTIPDQKRR
jgi:hypothetical protein